MLKYQLVVEIPIVVVQISWTPNTSSAYWVVCAVAGYNGMTELFSPSPATVWCHHGRPETAMNGYSFIVIILQVSSFDKRDQEHIQVLSFWNYNSSGSLARENYLSSFHLATIEQLTPTACPCKRAEHVGSQQEKRHYYCFLQCCIIEKADNSTARHTDKEHNCVVNRLQIRYYWTTSEVWEKSDVFLLTRHTVQLSTSGEKRHPRRPCDVVPRAARLLRWENIKHDSSRRRFILHEHGWSRTDTVKAESIAVRAQRRLDVSRRCTRHLFYTMNKWTRFTILLCVVVMTRESCNTIIFYDSLVMDSWHDENLGTAKASSRLLHVMQKILYHTIRILTAAFSMGQLLRSALTFRIFAYRLCFSASEQADLGAFYKHFQPNCMQSSGYCYHYSSLIPHLLYGGRFKTVAWLTNTRQYRAWLCYSDMPKQVATLVSNFPSIVNTYILYRQLGEVESNPLVYSGIVRSTQLSWT